MNNLHICLASIGGFPTLVSLSFGGGSPHDTYHTLPKGSNVVLFGVCYGLWV